MFKKLTPFEHHKSFMPFDHLFMTREQYIEFMQKTKPGDAPVVVTVTTPESKEILDGSEERSKIDLVPIFELLNVNVKPEN